MSTSSIFLQPDEIEDFVRGTTAKQGLYVIGEEGREIGLAPVISFYIYHTPEEFLVLCHKVLDIFDEFESSIIDEPFKLVSKGLTHLWLRPNDKRLKRPLDPVIQEAKDNEEPIFISATDMESTGETARWAFDAVVSDAIGHRYTRVKLTFRNRWYRQNKDRWHEFVQRCIQSLQPDQCYSGFEVGNGGFNFMGSYECDVLERISADYFFGMDIDHTGPMSFHNFNRVDDYVDRVSLGGGIRTPTWCFLLSPYWLQRLGKTEADVRAELSDPRIEITAVDYAATKIYPAGSKALWIRLGELDLYPVEEGVPELLVQANRLIRPVRCDDLELLTLHPWEGDPNPRFNFADSLRWMRRFDDDSDWPNPDVRRSLPANGRRPDDSTPMRALPGEPAPKTGSWLSVALQGEAGRVFRQAGEPLPGPAATEKGQVIWTFDGDQQQP